MIITKELLKTKGIFEVAREIAIEELPEYLGINIDPSGIINEISVEYDLKYEEAHDLLFNEFEEEAGYFYEYKVKDQWYDMPNPFMKPEVYLNEMIKETVNSILGDGYESIGYYDELEEHPGVDGELLTKRKIKSIIKGIKEIKTNDHLFKETVESDRQREKLFYDKWGKIFHMENKDLQ